MVENSQQEEVNDKDQAEEEKPLPIEEDPFADDGKDYDFNDSDNGDDEALQKI